MIEDIKLTTTNITEVSESIFMDQLTSKYPELIHLNINMVSFSIYLQNLVGHIFTMFILTLAAAEAAVGLAIIVIYYKNKGSIHVEQINSLKG